VDHDTRHRAILELNSRLRACRRCHLAGYLDERESIPLARDPDPDAPVPRILLVGQAPGLRATVEYTPFAGQAAVKMQGWFAQAGIAPEDFYRKIAFSAVTKCYPGRLPGARGDRVPTPTEQALCRPWLDAQLAAYDPAIVLLVGGLAIQAGLGLKVALTDLVGRGFEQAGRRWLPLPHPSGVSLWLNAPANQARVRQAMGVLRGWIEGLGLQ
jgi:uracil-DNA glycosylase